jgi:hypothetical protein
MSPVDKHQPDPKTATGTASMPFFPPPITRIEDTGLFLKYFIIKDILPVSN